MRWSNRGYVENDDETNVDHEDDHSVHNADDDESE